jgi:hypothetical protein
MTYKLLSITVQPNRNYVVKFERPDGGIDEFHFEEQEHSILDKDGNSLPIRLMTFDDNLSTLLRGRTGAIHSLMVALSKLGHALTLSLDD